MRKPLLLGLVALALPTAASAQFINEFSYDCSAPNDAGCEFVEVALPVGANPADYAVFFYNGNNPGSAVVYGPAGGTSLTTFTAGNTVDGFTLYSRDAPATPGGYIQNGANDGIALVNTTTNTVSELLSYEGAFTASNGPAAGQTATDVGVFQTNTTPAGTSIGRTGVGPLSTFALGASTPGALNTGQVNLPVELVAFTGAVNGTTARLSWTTASETNNAGFAVEEQTGNTWTERGFVAGRGTTTERHTYAFEVSGLTAGTHAFRLRQVDTDGTVHYSSVATVEIGVDGGSRVTLLGSRAVRVETSEAEAVSVRLFDVLGRMVSEQRAEVSGTVEFAVPAGLASGAYVVRVEGERFAATRTLVVR